MPNTLQDSDKLWHTYLPVQMATSFLSTCVLDLLCRRACGARLTLCRTSWAQDRRHQVGQASGCPSLHAHQTAVKHLQDV